MSSTQPDTPVDKISFLESAWRVVIGRPRDFKDPGVFHQISLAVFLAWVGLGSDAITSSAYGPDECYRRARSAQTNRGSLGGQVWRTRRALHAVDPADPS